MKKPPYITYSETVEILEDMVRLEVCTVKRGKTQVDDIYSITDFGIWLAEHDKYREYDDHPERRTELRRLFEADKKK